MLFIFSAIFFSSLSFISFLVCYGLRVHQRLISLIIFLDFLPRNRVENARILFSVAAPRHTNCRWIIFSRCVIQIYHWTSIGMKRKKANRNIKNLSARQWIKTRKKWEQKEFLSAQRDEGKFIRFMSSTFNVTFSTKTVFALRSEKVSCFSYLPFPPPFASLSFAPHTRTISLRATLFTSSRNMDREICLMDSCTWKYVWWSLGKVRGQVHCRTIAHRWIAIKKPNLPSMAAQQASKWEKFISNKLKKKLVVGFEAQVQRWSDSTAVVIKLTFVIK